MSLALRFLKTPSSRTSAWLSRVTRADHLPVGLVPLRLLEARPIARERFIDSSVPTVCACSDNAVSISGVAPTTLEVLYCRLAQAVLTTTSRPASELDNGGNRSGGNK
jgi:hypothetical protein